MSLQLQCFNPDKSWEECLLNISDGVGGYSHLDYDIAWKIRNQFYALECNREEFLSVRDLFSMLNFQENKTNLLHEILKALPILKVTKGY